MRSNGGAAAVANGGAGAAAGAEDDTGAAMVDTTIAGVRSDGGVADNTGVWSGAAANVAAGAEEREGDTTGALADGL